MSLLDALLQSREVTKSEADYERSSSTPPSSPPTEPRNTEPRPAAPTEAQNPARAGTLARTSGGLKSEKPSQVTDGVAAALDLKTNATSPRPTGPPAWRANTVPDSRPCVIAGAILRKIEAIEAEARALGWPAELLWNAGFWELPRGLAAVLDDYDEIVEVTAGCISILKLKSTLVRFNRHTA